MQWTPHTSEAIRAAHMCERIVSFFRAFFSHNRTREKIQIFNNFPLIQILLRFLSVVKQKKKAKRVFWIEIQKFHRHEHHTNSPCHISTTTSTGRNTPLAWSRSLFLTLNRFLFSTERSFYWRWRRLMMIRSPWQKNCVWSAHMGE